MPTGVVSLNRMNSPAVRYVVIPPLKSKLWAGEHDLSCLFFYFCAQHVEKMLACT